MKSTIVLIHPPLTKACEPPAGIARLASFLRANNINCKVIDANLEGTYFLLRNPNPTISATDNWTIQSLKHVDKNLLALKDNHTYKNTSRYSRKVMDINRVLKLAGRPYNADLSLADYQSNDLTPVKSSDLLQSAEKPESNPFYPYFKQRITSLLKENPGYIGFSLNYLSQALCTFAMIGCIKQLNPQQKIILGGSLTSSWIKITGRTDLFSGLVDSMVAGAGEIPLLTLFGKTGSTVSPLVDYQDFALDRYLSPGRIIPLSASRGCYWHRCSFCPEKAEDNPYQPLSSKNIINQLEDLAKEPASTLVHFLDNAISPALMNTLASSKITMPWYGFTRVTSHLADPDFCIALKKSGCVMLKLGIESGDQQVLDKLEKGVTVQETSAVLRSLHKAGIATFIYLLFGTPAEKEQSALKTLEFVNQHHEYIDFLNLAIFNLPVLSLEADQLNTYDFYEGDLSLYKNFKHPHDWNRPQVRSFLDATFKKSEAVSDIVKNTPPFFTSNHAPFFILNNAV